MSCSSAVTLRYVCGCWLLLYWQIGFCVLLLVFALYPDRYVCRCCYGSTLSASSLELGLWLFRAHMPRLCCFFGALVSACPVLSSQIFLKPDFALEDLTTFNTVLPWSHFNSAGGKSSRDVASSKLLQERVRTRTLGLFNAQRGLFVIWPTAQTINCSKYTSVRNTIKHRLIVSASLSTKCNNM